jgi:hypothetical protein
MAEERNLWQQLKRNTPEVVWTRIESSTALGIPDLHGFYRRCFWLELKIIKNNKINFSAHQIAWINRHYSIGCPVFVLARDPLPKTLKLFSGSIVRDPTSISDKPTLCEPGPGSWDLLLHLLGAWSPDVSSSARLH